MPSPSLIAREDEFADAEVVDAEPVLDPPSDLTVVLTAAARYAVHTGEDNEPGRTVMAAVRRLEAQQT